MEAPLDRTAELSCRQALAFARPDHQPRPARTAGAVALFHVERIRGAAKVLENIAALRAAGVEATGFQTEQWLSALFSDVAPHAGAEPSLVVLRRRESGAVALAMPLVVRAIGALRYGEFADLGLTDYCAPLVGSEPPATREEAVALIEALRSELRDVDIIRLEKMPAIIGGHANPLLLPEGSHPSRFSGNRLTVATTVNDYIASRGKKYRKEAERSRRRLEDMGTLTHSRATTVEEIDHAYQRLETWQQARHLRAGHDYRLSQPQVSKFYRGLLVANRNRDFANLFTIEVEGQLVAALLGITHGTTFTLLRIADAGEDWRHCSPGRMVVIEAMEYLVARGITTFDMGIGDYPFKRWIGCEPHPLYDRLIAITPRGHAHALFDRLKRRIRANQTLTTIACRIRHLATSDRRDHVTG